MKLTLLTILSLALCLACRGQSKPTEAWTGGVAATTIFNRINNDTPRIVRRDTQAIWFKALQFRQCRCLGVGDTVIEHWYHGWRIVEVLSSYHYTGVWEQIENDTQVSCYLMPDRKTKCTYKVVYAIK